MASGMEEVDPIKSNPTSHKAIGVVAMLVVLVGLSFAFVGDRRKRECPPPEPALEKGECCQQEKGFVTP